MATTSEYGWKVKTVRNSPSIDVKIKGQTHNCRILEQIIIAPSNDIIRIEQHISNTSDYHDVIIRHVTLEELGSDMDFS